MNSAMQESTFATDAASRCFLETAPWASPDSSCLALSGAAEGLLLRFGEPVQDPLEVGLEQAGVRRRRGSRPGYRSPSRPSSPRRLRRRRPARPAQARTSSASSIPRSWVPLQPAPGRSCRHDPASGQTFDSARSRKRPLEEGAAAVFAEDVAHRAADLADRGFGGERGADRVQQVARRRGRRRAGPPASPRRRPGRGPP